MDEFGARYYSSQYGRFTIPDWAAKATAVPYVDFGNPQTINLYTYARNNPVTVADPDGHCGDWFVACVVTAAVAATIYGIYKLDQWNKRRQAVENAAFEKSLGCTQGNASCTNKDIRSFDKKHIDTYTEGAIQGITNTIPSATPATSLEDIVIDKLKDWVVDEMVEDAKRDKNQQRPRQEDQENIGPDHHRKDREGFNPPEHIKQEIHQENGEKFPGYHNDD